MLQRLLCIHVSVYVLPCISKCFKCSLSLVMVAHILGFKKKLCMVFSKLISKFLNNSISIQICILLYLFQGNTQQEHLIASGSPLQGVTTARSGCHKMISILSSQIQYNLQHEWTSASPSRLDDSSYGILQQILSADLCTSSQIRCEFI